MNILSRERKTLPSLKIWHCVYFCFKRTGFLNTYTFSLYDISLCNCTFIQYTYFALSIAKNPEYNFMSQVSFESSWNYQRWLIVERVYLYACKHIWLFIGLYIDILCVFNVFRKSVQIFISLFWYWHSFAVLWVYTNINQKSKSYCWSDV